MEESDPDTPVLSGLALQALEDFRAEQALQFDSFEQLDYSHDQALCKDKALSIDMFPENWNASQFWYNDASATLLAQQLLDGMTPHTCIAVISTPSVFIQLKKLLLDKGLQPRRLCLLEWDERFRMFSEFTPYDFEKPQKLDRKTNLLPDESAALKGIFDRIICDPPYHSVDCQTKVAATVSWLLKPAEGQPNTVQDSMHMGNNRVIICTGDTMAATITKLYPNHFATTFSPSHTGNRLNNRYRCYADYECHEWTRLAD